MFELLFYAGTLDRQVLLNIIEVIGNEVYYIIFKREMRLQGLLFHECNSSQSAYER